MVSPTTVQHSSLTTFIDLFCGCGGFSAGLVQAGLTCLAGVDHNNLSVQTYQENHSSHTVSLVKDMTKFKPEELAKLVGTDHVDLIVGGPPCQGFSTVRQFAGSNSGERLVPDPRRELYRFFLKFVEFFRPKVFVMENVLGIKRMQNGIYFSAIQHEARSIGYRVIAEEVNAWECGVPQKRVRQLFVGTLSELPVFVPKQYIAKTHSPSHGTDGLLPLVTLGEAIDDLPVLEAGDERVVQDYDLSRRAKYLKTYSGSYLSDVLDVERSESLTWHCARPHNARDLRDFARLREGETSSKALARGVEMEFPYDKSSFKDRYTRQSRHGLCSTIVAHLKNDGLMFIHPTQGRSLTPREAARIQSFPDTFRFIGSRSDVFTQVGNAVPPLVGRSVGQGIKKYLEESAGKNKKSKRSAPKTVHFVRELEQFINDCSIRPISLVADDEFKEAWKKVRLLLPQLHPESVVDNGREISDVPRREISFCFEPYFIRSGWPVELVPIAQEARFRYQSGRLDASEFFHH